VGWLRRCGRSSAWAAVGGLTLLAVLIALPAGPESHAAANGIKPFLGTSPDPFADPNPAYFNRADAIIKLAVAHGITVFLDRLKPAAGSVISTRPASRRLQVRRLARQAL
jgi:hypothetical protein